jgi:hypothetical protein
MVVKFMYYKKIKEQDLNTNVKSVVMKEESYLMIRIIRGVVQNVIVLK